MFNPNNSFVSKEFAYKRFKANADNPFLIPAHKKRRYSSRLEKMAIRKSVRRHKDKLWKEKLFLAKKNRIEKIAHTWNTKNKVQYELILTLRNQGKTLDEIGREIGVTRERIRQIGKKIPGFRNKNPAKMYRLFCAVCGKEYEQRAYLSKKIKHRHCSRVCWEKSLVKNTRTLAEKRAIWNARTKAYYHSKLRGTPKFVAKTKLANQKYNETHLEERKKRSKEEYIIHAERMKTDPFYREKMRARFRLYERKKNERNRAKKKSELELARKKFFETVPKELVDKLLD